MAYFTSRTALFSVILLLTLYVIPTESSKMMSEPTLIKVSVHKYASVYKKISDVMLQARYNTSSIEKSLEAILQARSIIEYVVEEPETDFGEDTEEVHKVILKVPQEPEKIGEPQEVKEPLDPEIAENILYVERLYNMTLQWEDINTRKRDTYNITGRANTNVQPHQFMLEMVIPDIHPEQFYNLFTNYNFVHKQNEWNPMCISVDELFPPEDDINLTYRTRIEMPLFLSDREFIDSKTIFIHDGKYYVVMKNAEDIPAVETIFPKSSKYVRGETFFRIHQFEKTPEGGTLYRFYYQVDFNGYIPIYFFNKAVPKNTIKFVTAVVDFIKENMDNDHNNDD